MAGGTVGEWGWQLVPDSWRRIEKGRLNIANCTTSHGEAEGVLTLLRNASGKAGRGRKGGEETVPRDIDFTMIYLIQSSVVRFTRTQTKSCEAITVSSGHDDCCVKPDLDR